MDDEDKMWDRLSAFAGITIIVFFCTVMWLLSVGALGIAYSLFRAFFLA